MNHGVYKVIRPVSAAFFVLTTLACAAATAQPRVNPDAKVIADFKARLDQYVELRDAADNTAKPMKEAPVGAAGEIKEAQLSLAERIGVARKGAKQGDVFTPEAAARFKRLLRPEVKEKGTKEQIKDDNPETGVPFKVNATYPDKEPLSTVPPNVLQTLPPLPKDIEYRFVGKHLILRDARSHLIIDFILNALP
jgi:hypothetical protein